jgi:hypothetical protein
MVCVSLASLAQTSAATAGDKKAGTPSAADQTSSSGKRQKRKTASGKTSSRRKRTTRVRGQKKIDADRAQAIQEALIREHYLNGQATGTWNQASEDAMRRYQADHGWQSKTVPDSRALIKLGLGPSNDHLLNPDSAMTTGPDSPRVASASTNSTSPHVNATPAPAKGAPGGNSSIPQ